MTISELENRVRVLSLFAIASSLVLLLLLVSAFTIPGRQRFEVIDVERIKMPLIGPTADSGS